MFEKKPDIYMSTGFVEIDPFEFGEAVEYAASQERTGVRIIPSDNSIDYIIRFSSILDDSEYTPSFYVVYDNGVAIHYNCFDDEDFDCTVNLHISEKFEIVD